MARAISDKRITALRGILEHLVSRQKDEGGASRSTFHFSDQRSGEEGSKQGRYVRKAPVYRNETAPLHPVYKELARATNKSAYSIALSDRMAPPVIHRILWRAGTILIQASDNVMVAKVEVQVLGEQGEVLEQGDAVRLKADWWEYIPSYAGVKITAAAWDLAGNVTKAEI